MRRFLRLPITLALFVLIGSLFLTAGSAETAKTFYWQAFDVNIQLLENGDLDITEHQTLVFEGGDFTFGFAVIPFNGLDNINKVTVREGDIVYEEARTASPHTFKIDRESDEIAINWYFPPTRGQHTYTFSYTVTGAVRVEDSGDQLFWMAIPGDLPGGYVETASATIQVPTGVTPLSTIARFDGQASDNIDVAFDEAAGRTTFRLNETLFPDQTFEVGVRYPHGQLPLAAPDWQTQEQRGDVLNLIFVAISILMVIVGPIFAFLLWTLRGRDPEIGPVADMIAEPPSDLPPGLAGTLVDERADMRDVVATLIDLARRGYLKVNEKKSDHTFRRTMKPLEHLRGYEDTLMRKLFGTHQERKLSDLRYKFSRYLPSLHKQMYEELVSAEFVPISPDKVRKRYGTFFLFTIFGGFVLFMIAGGYSEIASAAICMPLALIPFAIGMAIVGQHMPRKTLNGTLEAAKWDAFKKYLKNIEDYTDLKEATDIFDKYLPYAIAFGIDRSWIRKFSKIETSRAPGWYGPYIPRRRNSRRTVRKGDVVPRGKAPSLDGMAEGMTGGLENMSKGLTKMLNSTSSVLKSVKSAPKSSGGGGFSGGFSGGSSGGGSRGFG